MPEESTEASELGWKPGFWPRHFSRNGELFSQERIIYSGEDFGGIEYKGNKGTILNVYND